MRGRLFAVAVCAGLITAPAISQDVRNTYIAVGAQIANGVIDLTTKVTGVLPAANGGAGTISGALKGNGSGTVSQAACSDLSNGGTACAQAYTETNCASTIAISTDATAGTPAYTAKICSAEQMGRNVTVRMNIVLSGWTGSPTGNVIITGLPVASANVANDWGQCFTSAYTVSGLAASNIGIGGTITNSTSQVLLQSFSASATTSITAAQFGAAGAGIRITCNYRAS